jgi:predicted nicotinamide N-methyase
MFAVPFPDFEVVLAQPSDPNRLLDELVAEEGDRPAPDLEDRIPYWAELWPSAVALSRELVEHPHWVRGKQVLEIGCGLGLPGIVAGKLGAKAMRLTDLLSEALIFARKNWETNLNSPADVHPMDWRNPRPDFAAEVVLASDIAYEKRFFEHLPQAFRRLLQPGGRLLLSEPGREMAETFLQRLPEYGFSMNSTVSRGSWDGLAYEVQILEVKNDEYF